MDSCQSIKFELKVIKAVIQKENLDGLSNGNNINNVEKKQPKSSTFSSVK
jgi:hypothetical protein